MRDYGELVKDTHRAARRIMEVAGRQDVEMSRALGEYRKAVAAQERLQIQQKIGHVFLEADR